MGNNSKFVSEEILEKAKEALHSLVNDPEPSKLKKRLKAVGVVTFVLEAAGIKPILVGGNAVELYTFGSYTTVDVDLVLNGFDTADKIFIELGFDPKAPGHSHWYYAELDLAIEIPDDTLLGSVERITEVEAGEYTVYVIGIEDIILDRLRAGVAWKSTSDMEMAKYLLEAYSGQEGFDMEYLKSAANGTKENNVYHDLLKLLKEVQQ